MLRARLVYACNESAKKRPDLEYCRKSYQDKWGTLHAILCQKCRHLSSYIILIFYQKFKSVYCNMHISDTYKPHIC